jgi:hypothetical protein
MSDTTNDIHALLAYMETVPRPDLRANLTALVAERDGLLRALEEIANQDYRGNGSNESLIAQRALAAMRKGEADGK